LRRLACGRRGVPEHFTGEGSARLAERREQQLILAYCQFLREKGSHVTRHLIRPEGEAKPIFSNLYDTTRKPARSQGHRTREASPAAFTLATPVRSIGSL